MPRLVQPRTLLKICYAKFALTLATAIKNAGNDCTKIKVLKRLAGELASTDGVFSYEVLT